MNARTGVAAELIVAAGTEMVEKVWRARVI